MVSTLFPQIILCDDHGFNSCTVSGLGLVAALSAAIKSIAENVDAGWYGNLASAHVVPFLCRLLQIGTCVNSIEEQGKYRRRPVSLKGEHLGEGIDGTK